MQSEGRPLQSWRPFCYGFYVLIYIVRSDEDIHPDTQTAFNIIRAIPNPETHPQMTQ